MNRLHTSLLAAGVACKRMKRRVAKLKYLILLLFSAILRSFCL